MLYTSKIGTILILNNKKILKITWKNIRQLFKKKIKINLYKKAIILNNKNTIDLYENYNASDYDWAFKYINNKPLNYDKIFNIEFVVEDNMNCDSPHSLIYTFLTIKIHKRKNKIFISYTEKESHILSHFIKSLINDMIYDNINPQLHINNKLTDFSNIINIYIELIKTDYLIITTNTPKVNLKETIHYFSFNGISHTHVLK